MAYKLNIGKVANQAQAPIRMAGSPMQQKDLNFKGNNGSKPTASAKVVNDYTYNPDKQEYQASDFGAFMNRPMTSMQSKGFNLKLPKPTVRNILPGATAGAIRSFAKNTGAVKSGKTNLTNATNTTNAFQNSSQFQNSQSLYDGANSIMNKYPGCGWNGMECLPTTQAIQDGSHDWTYFTNMANIDAGNMTWGNFTASTPENFQTADQIKENLQTNQTNIDNQASAASSLKSAQNKRTRSTIGGAIIGGGLNYLASAGINKVKEKIRENKEKKKQPKFD